MRRTLQPNDRVRVRDDTTDYPGQSGAILTAIDGSLWGVELDSGVQWAFFQDELELVAALMDVPVIIYVGTDEGIAEGVNQ